MLAQAQRIGIGRVLGLQFPRLDHARVKHERAAAAVVAEADVVGPMLAAPDDFDRDCYRILRKGLETHLHNVVLL